MPGSVREMIRRHAVLAVLAVAGAVAGADYAVAVLFAPARAVMHDGHLVFAECNLPPAESGRNCVAQYEFILGNTGRHEENVIAAWPAVIGRWSLQTRVQNIAADEPRSRDPEVSCDAPADRTECRVQGLAPGALLILQFRCLPCGGEEVTGLAEVRPELRAESGARVYRGDPRVNVLVRRLQVLFY